MDFTVGTGSETLAHAFYPKDGDIHFNDDVDWTVTGEANKKDLLQVAVHEIGHAIGLQHTPQLTSVPVSIMHPLYQNHSHTHLFVDDIAGAQAHYGKFKGFIIKSGSIK